VADARSSSGSWTSAGEGDVGRLAVLMEERLAQQSVVMLYSCA
jgi:hypothetical protein